MDARLARSQEEPDPPYAAGESAFRIDLERIRFATALSRLADVTQVVTSMATSGVVHNRLTHTIKVTAVARAIAVRLLRTENPDLLHDLGGLDHVVVQAAATAHDLGHPPFGHLGERVLDRLARERFGLADGFEGIAQTFRVLTELEVLGPGDQGLNLTAATRCRAEVSVGLLLLSRSASHSLAGTAARRRAFARHRSSEILRLRH
jgi:dGTPase